MAYWPYLSLTVNEKGEPKCKLVRSKQDDPFQRFRIIQKGRECALVVSGNGATLKVHKDEVYENQFIVASPQQSDSSWLTFERCSSGPWEGKGYLVRTHGMNKVLGIEKIEDVIYAKQVDCGNRHSQMWLLVPADNKIPTEEQIKKVQHAQQIAQGK